LIFAYRRFATASLIFPIFDFPDIVMGFICSVGNVVTALIARTLRQKIFEPLGMPIFDLRHTMRNDIGLFYD
jgi:hypothetical protein